MAKKSVSGLLLNEARRIVYGEVYSPNILDADDETMSAADVEKAAYSFLLNGGVTKIDISHDFKKSGCYVVETFLARQNDLDFTPGAWVLGIKVPDDSIWGKILKGELNGFSGSFLSVKSPREVLVNITRKYVGLTEPSLVGPLPPHIHTVTILFDDNGKLASGVTDKVLGHKHKVIQLTGTVASLDHSHRFFVDATSPEVDEEE